MDRMPARRQLRRPGAPRQVRHVVMVTEEQEARLASKAEARRVTIPRLLVESTLADPPKIGQVVVEPTPIAVEVAAELFGITRMLDKLGVNVNQIAKATNATGEVQESTGHTMDAIKRVCARLNECIDHLDPRRQA